MSENGLIANESKALEIIREVSGGSIEERRGKIELLESKMLEFEQLEIPVTHRFSGGVYAREITIPKGAILTGRIHKFDHFDIMLSGDISVSTDDGHVRRLTGYNVFEGKAGKKRAGYAHEDTKWITFHSAEERDPEEMYELLTCGTFEEFEQFTIMFNEAVEQIAHSEEVLTEHAAEMSEQKE